MEQLPSVIHQSWHPFLQRVFDDDFGLQLLKNRILQDCKFYPHPNNIFRVFSMPINDIKVVILGQDPYPNEGQAIGYAFAVAKGVKKPRSLQIIEKEVGHELDETLESWVQQGVFLLNTALTVQEKSAGSHLDFWHSFTVGVIRAIANSVSPIWLLWGKKAQAFEVHIRGVQHGYRNIVFKAPHPAAEAYSGGTAGFYGCNHFKLVNQVLAEKFHSTINF